MPLPPHRPRDVRDAGVLGEIIAAYDRLSTAEGKRIESLFSESSKILNMADPLKVDLGVHEWLKGRKEENYSAWLAWCLRQLRPSEVLEVLRLEVPDQVDEQPDYPAAWCEYPVSAGEVGKTGRLDILLEVTSAKIVVLEVKTGSADAARVLKHEGYVASLEKLFPDAERFFVLVATDGSQSEYHGFQLLPWRNVTLSLRRRIPAVRERVGIVQAAMVAGFVGAVERNILGLDRVDYAQFARYLEEFVEAQP